MPVQQFGPDPDNSTPIAAAPQLGFLKPLVEDPKIEIGEYTYYDDPEGPQHFVEKCVRYHFEHMGDKLVIGKFCAIAQGVQFIMNGANHAVDGFSTFPFTIFGNGWEDANVDWTKGSRGDTVIGNDVWIGTDALILPGVRVGDGAIIGARAVIASDVPAYGVAVGHPGRTIKQRFDEQTIEKLRHIAWWDWPPAKITANLNAIRGGDIVALSAAASG